VAQLRRRGRPSRLTSGPRGPGVAPRLLRMGASLSVWTAYRRRPAARTSKSRQRGSEAVS
jgi:hypothetical protein